MNNSTNFQANLSLTSSAPSATRVPRNLAIFIVTFVAICVSAGAFGNARVCVLLSKRQDLRKVPHYFLANLAMTGVLSSVIHAPLIIVMTVANYFQIRGESVVEILCRATFPSGFAFIVLNAPTLWLMALDRQDCVCRPFRRRLTTSNVKKIIPVMWMLSLLTYVFIVMAMRNESFACIQIYPYSNDPPKFSRPMVGLIAIVGQLDNVTVLIIIVTFFRVMKRMRSPTVNSSLNSTFQRQEKTLTMLTYKICGVFLLCRVPNNAHFFLKKIGGFQSTPAATLVTITLIHLMYVANPFIYHKMLKVRFTNRERATVRQAVEPRELANSAKEKSG